MDDMLIRVLGCLLQVLRDHGQAAYRRAGRGALTAVCRVLIEEAGGGVKSPRPAGKVVRFPLPIGRQRDDDE